MGKLAMIGLLGGIAVGMVPPAVPGPLVAAAHAKGSLCRRAAPLPPLPPEPKAQPAGQRGRWDSRHPVPPPVMAPPPAPPSPPTMMEPPMPEVAAPAETGGDVVVTATRVAPPAEAADVGRLPDSSVAEAAARMPDATDKESRFVPREPQPHAGLLTAGDHDDLLNPELYARYVDKFLENETLKGVPRVDTGRVLTVAVQDQAGRPIPFAPVTLTCADGNTLTLGTLADGTAVFFPELDRLGSKVRLSVGGVARDVSISGAAGQQRQSVTLASSAAEVRRFDLAVVVDATGSMGDELQYLKAELRAILADLSRRHAGLDIRLALIAYRDEGDEYVTRTFPFTGNVDSIQANLQAQYADGGGDEPEAVEQALARAMALQWRPDAVKSLLWVADAPPHAEDVAPSWAAAEVARARRIQIVPVAASDTNEGAEYLMRAAAAATQSRYLFLTDDSGIGNPHAPPAVDCYLVTKLDALIRRTLDSQIAGRRVEPGDGEVIRAVGNYDHGRCILPPGFGQRD